MTNPKVTLKGRPALSAPIRVTDATARRLDALADRLALRKVDLTRIAGKFKVGEVDSANTCSTMRSKESQEEDGPTHGVGTSPPVFFWRTHA